MVVVVVEGIRAEEVDEAEEEDGEEGEEELQQIAPRQEKKDIMAMADCDSRSP